MSLYFGTKQKNKLPGSMEKQPDSENKASGVLGKMPQMQNKAYGVLEKMPQMQKDKAFSVLEKRL